MSDYDRFLRTARREAAHVGRIAARLLAEGRINMAVHGALAHAASEILHGAYMAGRCEPAGVSDLRAELERVGADA